MSDDDQFELRLGRQRGAGTRRPASYASRVAVAARLNAGKGAARSRRFDGSRIGRGAGLGRLLSSRDGLAASRTRRTVVKTRLVRLGGRSMGAAKAHLRYLQRDGVTREGTPGELYGAETNHADGKAFLERSRDDRHQFRFIVSAEDGDLYPDLKPFIRRLMSQVEEDLGTRLDWIAVDHFNTGHPHSHVVLRGVDDRGQNLVIAREYISHGLRERAAELVTLDLGPRTTHEIEQRLRHDVGQERLTAIDRRLIARMDAGRAVAQHANDPLFHALERGRLQVLKRMDLAEDLGGGNWRLAAGIEDTLRTMGERGDIIRLMQRELTRAKLARSDHRIYGPGSGLLVGKVITRGLADEHRDRHYLLVDGIDGHSHYVDIGRAGSLESLPEGATVRIAPAAARVRAIDHAIADVAAASDGRYSIALHLRHDRSATQAFAETHVRRLEAMRRARLGVVRDPDGTWQIAADHLDQAERFEQRLLRERPVIVELVSPEPVDRLAGIEGATWLDKELSAPSGMHVRDAGFGRELREALDARRQWLVDQDLAEMEREGIRLRTNALTILQRRELLRIAARLCSDTGKDFVETKIGERIEGRVVRRIDMASGRFALIEKSREFTLVPWRPVMEKQIGRKASGILRESGISWRFGRGRKGPEIS
ncbi:conjugal transfer protein TraI [Novosphingobium endophyticum]|uniref:Conjugal transfer protein TraI n=1 Tax=Novosphingobium endophyticum TaxID=1955250 RepID=A0A916TUA7_9SPHN|nr:relaxase/mobilization nuclease RlxS [Novosphingobium endophyticum]GGC04891.1 conjugal transfer protein TraI [Novosphingobium endophyticum]